MPSEFSSTNFEVLSEGQGLCMVGATKAGIDTHWSGLGHMPFRKKTAMSRALWLHCRSHMLTLGTVDTVRAERSRKGHLGAVSSKKRIDAAEVVPLPEARNGCLPSSGREPCVGTFHKNTYTAGPSPLQKHVPCSHIFSSLGK